MPVKYLSFRLTGWWNCILNIWMQCRWPTRRLKGKNTYVSLPVFCQLLTCTPLGPLCTSYLPTGQARAKVPSTFVCHLTCRKSWADDSPPVVITALFTGVKSLKRMDVYNWSRSDLGVWVVAQVPLIRASLRKSDQSTVLWLGTTVAECVLAHTLAGFCSHREALEGNCEVIEYSSRICRWNLET